MAEKTPSEFDRAPVYDTPADVEQVVTLMKGEKPKPPPER